MANTSIAAVEEAMEAVRKAMVSGDRAVLERHAAEELTYTHSVGRTENRQQFLEGALKGSARRSARGASLEEVVSDQAVTLIDNVAVVNYVMKQVPRTPGQEGGSAVKVLAVWMLRDGQWQMIARQAAKI